MLDFTYQRDERGKGFVRDFDRNNNIEEKLGHSFYPPHQEE